MEERAERLGGGGGRRVVVGEHTLGRVYPTPFHPSHTRTHTQTGKALVYQEGC